MRSWIGRRRQFGIYDQLLVELRSEDTRCFKNFMRMVPEMFDELLARVSPRITKKHTWYRRPLEPGLKLSLTLRHLASGSTYSAMKYGWRVPHNTQSLIVKEVCQAIIDEYMSEVMTCPTTPEGWRAISDKFLKRWNFPHTCGAIDGKHIACKCPPKSGSQYFNYKGFYSVVLMGLVDADYKFIWADLGGKGSSSDAQIYNNSEIKELTEDGTIGFPVPDALPNDYQSVPYIFVGEDAFALRETMMKPYSRRDLHYEERIFNYRISRARRVVENVFGILTNRFQVLLTTMQNHPDAVKLIVKACIVLHNLMRIRYPELQNQHLDHAENMNNIFIPGSWRQDRNLLDTHTVVGRNTSTNKGKGLRNLLKHWVNSEAGAFP
ncbi:protein ANTAGONIST OF LIKE HETEROCHROMATIN PROTEIN 1-like [Dendronephthya gigantea]|uniref:protein ANTAGONIST OF LIKE HETEROCHROMATIN PROTEIN 1-like n=1 Tax=Dendronephthya gigantea TaxID=151771 RepID=UPI00106D567B|nr:protein ANTAGONIST OF LIKE HETEROCHROMATIN PROTEIN 1-like [Dendronephthya gigantea]